jgi:hypothetical protein
MVASSVLTFIIVKLLKLCKKQKVVNLEDERGVKAQQNFNDQIQININNNTNISDHTLGLPAHHKNMT